MAQASAIEGFRAAYHARRGKAPSSEAEDMAIKCFGLGYTLPEVLASMCPGEHDYDADRDGEALAHRAMTARL